MYSPDFDYYLQDIPEEEKTKIHEGVAHDLMKMHYKDVRRIVLPFSYLQDVKEEIKRKQYIFKEEPYPTIFVIIVATILPYGKEDKLENYQLCFEISNTKIIKTVPLLAILNWTTCGYPKAGTDPRYFTDYPWRILKPLKEYIFDKIDFITFQQRVYKDKVLRDSFFIDYYQDTLPYILNTQEETPLFKRNIWLKYNEYYQRNIDEMKEEHLKHSKYNPMYVTIMHQNITEAHFLPDKKVDNPFIELELECLRTMFKK